MGPVRGSGSDRDAANTRLRRTWNDGVFARVLLIANAAFLVVGAIYLLLRTRIEVGAAFQLYALLVVLVPVAFGLGLVGLGAGLVQGRIVWLRPSELLVFLAISAFGVLSLLIPPYSP